MTVSGAGGICAQPAHSVDCNATASQSVISDTDMVSSIATAALPLNLSPARFGTIERLTVLGDAEGLEPNRCGVY